MHSTAYSAGDLGHVDEPVVARCLGPLGGVYGLAAQRREIGAACKAKGWKAGKIYTDVSSGKTTNGRAGLSTALGRLAAGTADALVVAKLDRVSRSVRDTANLLERAKEERWQLVVLDNTGIDTTTPNGRMFANLMATLAEWEREMISERTKAALAEARAAGKPIGRAPLVRDDIRKRIRREHARGVTYGQIAKGLNDDGVPTAHGGRQWWPATVKKIAEAKR
jgi:DNA invertase Pin-like site-specific DNA recombinase